jgi:SAM-dependent methyltransferase
VNWQVKAYVQSALSRLPLGDKMNFVLARYVTKTQPVSTEVFKRNAAFAREHLDSFHKFGISPIEDARFYEFGGGWDLTIPLTFYSLGVNHQTVVDLRRLVKAALVRESARRLSVGSQQFELSRNPDGLANSSTRAQLVDMLRTHYGINYRAPFDAQRSGIESGTIDYISATSVLQHIPVEALRGILRECYRILRPGGLIRVLNDYKDNYSYVDQSISVYNFLKFSDEEWKRFNPTLHYQNRLRHVDHMRLFIDAGLDLIENDATRSRSASDEMLGQITLAKKFRHYSLDDLLPVRGVILARKPASDAS